MRVESQIRLVEQLHQLLALGNHNSPFLIPNVPDTFTVGRLHQKQKKKREKGDYTETTMF